MNLPYFQKVITIILYCIFYLLSGHAIHAQDQTAVDTVNFILKKKKTVAETGSDLKDVGNYYLNRNELANASLVRDRIMQYAKENNYQNGIYDAYGLSGTIAIFENDFSKARGIAKEWLIDAKNRSSDYGMNGAHFLLVRTMYSQGKLDSVIILAKRVLESNQANYDSIYFPRFHGMMGSVYLRKGDFQNANDAFLKALTIAELTGNEQIQSVCIGNLGIINKELKNYREAMKYYKKALELRIKHNMLHDVAGTYVSMATCSEFLLKNDSAVILFNKALELFKQLDSKVNIAMVYNNLGQVLVRMNQHDSGIQHLRQAKEVFTSLNDSINLAYNAWAIGDAWWEISKMKNDKSYLGSAIKEMQVSKNLAELLRMESLKMNCYISLSEMYESNGNEEEAFSYLKLYNVIRDSIRSQEYTNQIAEMQTKYDSEKKEMEIDKLSAAKLLDAEKMSRQKTLNYSLLAIAGLMLVSGFSIYRNVQGKRIVEKQVAILEKQNAIESMRSKIASDVHDEMGANLTRLGLNAQQLLLSSDVPEKEKLLAEKMNLQSKEIITGMREIIWSSNPANDNLKSMLGFMRQYIDRFFDGTNIRPVVNFPNDVGEVVLHPEVRRNLFLILKESLNNAVKYSDSDRIEIDFRNEDEKFNLNIKDFGKGIDDKSKDEFSNGIRNMQMRAEQIQSFFRLITGPGKGVQIIVEGKLY